MTVVYDAILVHDTDSQGYFCNFPYPVEQLFGKKRVKIKVLIDNTVLYRGTLSPMCGIYRVMLNKQIREQVGKQAGDTVHLEVEEDKEVRTIELPLDFAQAINSAELQPYFESLAYTHQKEYVQWITSAKKSETRLNRIEKAIAMLQNRIKHP